MINKWTSAALSALAISASAQAQTIESQNIGLNFDALAGMRWGEVDLSETETNEGAAAFFRAQEYKIGASYQIPNLPLSAGVNLGFIDYNNKNTYFGSEATKSAFEFDTSVEAKIWVPTDIMPTDVVVPYAKASYTPFSIYRQEITQEGQAESRKIQGDNNGFSVGLGANVKVVENVSGAIEYTYARRSLTAEDKDTNVSVHSKQNLASHGVLVGVTAHL